MNVRKVKTDRIHLQEAQTEAGREYKPCKRAEASLKIILHGRPDADAKRRQETFYFKEA